VFGKVPWSRERAKCCCSQDFLRDGGLFYLAGVTLVSLLNAKKRGEGEQSTGAQAEWLALLEFGIRRVAPLQS